MFNPIVPYANFTQFTPALPEFYWNVYSAEQRMKHLCMELGKLVSYCDEIATELNNLENEVDSKLKSWYDMVMKLYLGFRKEILDILEQLEMGTLQWDVQHGEFADTVTAQRDMFNDLTLHSYNCGQLEEIFDRIGMDVAGLADCGLNVRGFAVMNHLLMVPDSLTPDLRPDVDQDNILTVTQLATAMVDLQGYLYV